MENYWGKLSDCNEERADHDMKDAFNDSVGRVCCAVGGTHVVGREIEKQAEQLQALVCWFGEPLACLQRMFTGALALQHC